MTLEAKTNIKGRCRISARRWILRFGFIDHQKGRVGRLFCPASSSLLPTRTYKHIVSFSVHFLRASLSFPCPSFPSFFPLFSSLPLFPCTPFSSFHPAVPVPCPLAPKLRGQVVFLKQWGNHLWRREQKEIFTVSVMKWIFARRMESVNRVSRLVGKDN